MVVFRIIRNLLRIIIATALLPLLLFIRRYSSIIVILILGVAIYQCTTPDSTPPKNVDRDGKILPIDPVKKEENGNSQFATDLIKKMKEHERLLYSKHFYWAMNKAGVNEQHRWQEHNIEGEITITESFTNKNGVPCKRFYEVLKVHEIRQTLTGLACQKTKEAWCKLRNDSTPACDLGGQQPGFFNGLQDSIGNLF